ncbi:CHASE2 domain-containing protein [Paraburkholderia acidisoli]|uniref:CHASE2 domain-containing protein n=1 Tax=Paraburkholderia acidisoli TaxID=2571748 RepID=A0A7Z2GFM1_9BURK|nr:CHASE2 domain-containing protein [Paraburkholderia acidisoli]QGZ60903.1 CHASE2 domain-containing protein [Paraburkholderia acidisoli]
MNARIRGASGATRKRKRKLGAALSKRTILQALLAIVLGIVAALVLPHVFGEEFATRKAARVYAPVAGQIYGTGSRDGISVMLIDDAALSQAGQTWPASYGYYARLLRGMQSYHPRAVFFDIVFKDARPDPALAPFVQGLCALREAGTRVYLAATPDAHGKLRVRDGLAQYAGRCFDLVAVSYSPDEIDKLAWSYPLEQRTGEGPAQRSAALAIHDDFAKRPLADARTPMALLWGLEPAADGLRLLAQPEARESDAAPAPKAPAEGGEANAANEDGAPEAAEPYCRTDHGFAEILPFGPHQWLFHDAEKPVCVFHETVYAYDLANDDDEGEAMLKRALTNRVVMIGTARSYSNDYVNSPIHGRIPGVYLHAMALDNLDTFGDQYKHVAALAPSLDRDHRSLFVLVFGGLLAVVLVRVAKNCLRNEERRERDRFELSWPWAGQRTREAIVWVGMSLIEIVASIALVGILLAIGQSVFNIGFLSVVDIAVFALAAEWFEWNEKLVDWLLGPEDEARNDADENPNTAASNKKAAHQEANQERA